MQSTVISTRAIVLSVHESGESSRMISMLSEEVGLVWCLAQGSRNITSKQRLHLKPLSVVEAVLIRGARLRVRSAIEIITTARTLFDKSEGMSSYEAVCRVCRLVQRITPPGEYNPSLYNVLENFVYKALETNNNLSEIELLAVLKILERLGYIGDNPLSLSLVRGGSYDEHLVEQVQESRTELLKIANDSIKASML